MLDTFESADVFVGPNDDNADNPVHLLLSRRPRYPKDFMKLDIQEFSRRFWAIGSLLLGAASLTGCVQTDNNASGVGPEGPLVSIAVTPADSTAALGIAQQYLASGTYADGSVRELTGRVVWVVGDPSVATISNESGTRGMLTGTVLGATTVVATEPNSGLNGGTTVTVVATKLQSVAVSLPATAGSLPAGFSAQLSAIGTFSDGSTSDVTNASTWLSTTPAVAVVSDQPESKGLLSGIAPGDAALQIVVGGLTTDITIPISAATLAGITVTPPNAVVGGGLTLQLAAVGQFSDGNLVEITEQATWLSDNALIVAVSDAPGSKGLVTGGLLPLLAANISATVNGVTGSAVVSRSLP